MSDTQTVTPRQWTVCRWCKSPFTQWTASWLVRIGFCSRACMQDRYNEEG